MDDRIDGPQHRQRFLLSLRILAGPWKRPQMPHEQASSGHGESRCLEPVTAPAPPERREGERCVVLAAGLIGRWTWTVHGAWPKSRPCPIPMRLSRMPSPKVPTWNSGAEGPSPTGSVPEVTVARMSHWSRAPARMGHVGKKPGNGRADYGSMEQSPCSGYWSQFMACARCVAQQSAGAQPLRRSH